MPVTECIAVYIRLSWEDNDVDGTIKAESNSVSAQRMLINEFIKKQDEFTNCPVVEYVDDGYSGTNFNRPGFQRMMEDAKAGRIKSIVIKDFSRFGRDYLEVGNYKLVSNDKEEWIVVENAHEPIISDELFQKANEKAFTNQKRVLTKRGIACPIFFCPTCGRRLGFTSRETGYRCMQAHISGLSGCAESKMDRKEAEETVLDAAKNMAQFISENLEKKKSEWHKTILKEENIATLESEKKRLSSRKMKLYSDYRSEVLDKEGYMEELEKTTSRISEITLQIAELENEIAVAKKKCDEATEKEMEVNEIAALQDFDKIQLSKIIEKVFIYEPGRMEISWKMDDIFYKEEKA